MSNENLFHRLGLYKDELYESPAEQPLL